MSSAAWTSTWICTSPRRSTGNHITTVIVGPGYSAGEATVAAGGDLRLRLDGNHFRLTAHATTPATTMTRRISPQIPP